MISKVICLSAVIVLCVARPQSSHGNDHSHAYSSQSIVLHASEGHQQQHAGAHHGQYQPHHDDSHEHYGHPKYEFEYKVEDPHTGDKKFQHEARDGDQVKGVYSLHEADGTVRVVEYTADKHTGFNAVVKREGHAKHVIPEHKYHH